MLVTKFEELTIEIKTISILAGVFTTTTKIQELDEIYIIYHKDIS